MGGPVPRLASVTNGPEPVAELAIRANSQFWNDPLASIDMMGLGMSTGFDRGKFRFAMYFNRLNPSVVSSGGIGGDAGAVNRLYFESWLSTGDAIH